jgi:hypothetical protein
MQHLRTERKRTRQVQAGAQRSRVGEALKARRMLGQQTPDRDDAPVSEANHRAGRERQTLGQWYRTQQFRSLGGSRATRIEGGNEHDRDDERR